MKCPRCRTQNPDDAIFCDECGARLEGACPTCGSINRLTAKFCSQCGKPTREVAEGDLPSSLSVPAPDSHTPKHLAERILAARATLQDERKQVTVLFADVRGSTELIADRDPEETDDLLSSILKVMMDAIHRFEGTVTRLMGDGLMALFGAPLAHEDHAARACYAALSMLQTVQQHNADLRRQHGVTVQIRVGLNSGAVVVRAMGNDLCLDYTAMGKTTHLGARMEQLAMPGTIVLTDDTRRLVEGLVRVTSLGPVPVKGLREPVEIYELNGVESTRTRLQAAAQRGLSPFIGRDVDIQILNETMQRVTHGQGQIVGVVGEAGVGKTRLFYEFSSSLRGAGWLTLETDPAAAHGQAVAYGPAVELLKNYFQIKDQDDPHRVREIVSNRLLASDRALESDLAPILSLLNVEVDDPTWVNLDPPQRRQRMLAAFKHLFLRESYLQPVCLIFENLHWIDSGTQTILDSLVESLPTAQILLLVNYRPEYHHEWAGKTYYTQLRLDPLSHENVQSLLRALLGDDASLQPLKSALTERTEGNPFFLEETVHAVVEAGRLAGRRGRYRLKGSFSQIEIPATVQAVLAARIDRLARDDKRVLQTAAVIGKDIPYALLKNVADLSEEDLLRSIATLRSAEFLYELSLFPEIEYTFKHGLTHEVAYDSLLQRRRIPLHRSILQSSETLYANRLNERADQLAHHALRGEVWDKAFTYLRQAGNSAVARSAYREAVTYFNRAHDVFEHLPKNEDTIAQTVDLLFATRTSHFALGEFDKMHDDLAEAEHLAQRLNDRARRGQVAAYMTNYLFWVGIPKRARETGERSLAIAAELNDFALKVRTNQALGQACYALGDYRTALDLLDRNVRALTGDRIDRRCGLASHPAATSRGVAVWCFTELGRFAEGLAMAEDCVRVAEELDNPSSLTVALFSKGKLHLRRGEFPEAITTLDRAVEFLRTFHIPFLLPLLTSAMGLTYALAGRVHQGLPLLEQAVEQGMSMHLLADHSLCLTQLGEALSLAGRFDEAEKVAQHALQRAQEYGERGNEAWASRLLGELAMRRQGKDLEASRQYLRQAIAQAEELGMAPLLALCRLSHSRLSRALSEPDEVKELLNTCRLSFRDMGMQFWLEQSEMEGGRTIGTD